MSSILLALRVYVIGRVVDIGTIAGDIMSRKRDEVAIYSSYV